MIFRDLATPSWRKRAARSKARLSPRAVLRIASGDGAPIREFDIVVEFLESLDEMFTDGFASSFFVVVGSEIVVGGSSLEAAAEDQTSAGEGRHRTNEAAAEPRGGPFETVSVYRRQLVARRRRTIAAPTARSSVRKASPIGLTVGTSSGFVKARSPLMTNGNACWGVP